jgi:hypothetical protein
VKRRVKQITMQVVSGKLRPAAAQEKLAGIARELTSSPATIRLMRCAVKECQTELRGVLENMLVLLDTACKDDKHMCVVAERARRSLAAPSIGFDEYRAFTTSIVPSGSREK